MTTEITNPPIGTWIDRVNPSRKDIDEIMQSYDFHELDREAILEEHQYARLDPYDDYIFLVLHFPKYNPVTERYIHNELNIFVGADFLITFRYYQSNTMRRVYSDYEKRIGSEEEEYNAPAFLLYDIIEAYLDKTMKMLERFSRDLRFLEKELFSSRTHDTIRDLMVKKRNIITLKHMMKPQIPVLRLTESHMK